MSDEDVLTEINPNDLQKRVLKEMGSFDLEKFFEGKGASTGAVAVITSKQMIITDTFIKTYGYGLHFDAVREIYKAIFNDSRKDTIDEGEGHIQWQDFIMNDGNVIMQFIYEMNNLIFIPNDITPEQIDFLNGFNEKIKIISKKSKNPIVFHSFMMIPDEKYETFSDDVNSIDNLLETLDLYMSKNKRR